MVIKLIVNLLFGDVIEVRCNVSEHLNVSKVESIHLSVKHETRAGNN